MFTQRQFSFGDRLTTLISVTAFFAAPATCSLAADANEGRSAWVFIGTYTGGKSQGIYRSTIELATGKLSDPELAAKIKDPSFLAIHPSGKFLYSVGEVGTFAGKPGGALSAFAVEPKSGSLKLLNQQSSRGGGPCHLVVDRDGKNLLVANYGGGSVAVLPIEAEQNNVFSLRPVIVIWIAKWHENYAYRNETNDGYRTKFYSPQSFHGRWREHVILSGISQHLERLIERHEKRNRRGIRKRQKGILEIDLKERGVLVSAFEVRFPKQESESADADEHNDDLKKYS